MKLKASAYHIPVFIYRYGFIALTLPLQTILLDSASTTLSACIYILNLLITAGIVLCACVSQRQIQCTATHKLFCFSKGILLHSRTFLPLKKANTIRITRGPIQNRLKICRLTIISSDTQSSVYISRSTMQKFIGNRNSAEIYRNTAFSTLLLSVGFYNAFTGALTLIPLLKKISSFSKAYESPTDFLPDTFDIYTLKELSAILFALSVLIVTLWCTGVIVTFLRYANLTFSRSGSFLKLHQGIFVKRTTYLNPQNISAVILRQNLLLILCNRYTGEFRTACDKRENKATFLCGAKCEKAQNILCKSGFKPEYENTPIFPHPKSLWGYTYLPVTLLCFVFAAEIVTDIHFVNAYKTRIGLLVILWLSAWFFFRVCIWSRCFIASNKNSVYVACFFGLTYCKAYIPKSKIRCIKITQSPFQRAKNTCSLRIFVKGRTKKSYFIKHIEKEKAAELRKELCG